MAVTVDAITVYANPGEIEDPATVAALLGPLAGVPSADLAERLSRDTSFVYVARQLERRNADRVAEADLPGVYFTEEFKRVYPAGSLAAHVLGWAGLDNTGMSGVEYAHEKEIAGRAAQVVVHTDARRRPVGHTERPSTEGHTVMLALDERVQHIAERELERSMRETRAIAGAVIVVEPFSGDVLAMAGRPTFNPNRYSAYPASRWRNRMVSDVFEPGSIFKIVTAAAGIQEGVVAPYEVLDCGNGQILVASTVINATFAPMTR